MTFLARLDRFVARWERRTAVGLLAVTVVIVILQVFFRYVLNSSLSWSEEAARYLFIWASVLGFSSCIEAGRLFRFEMLAAHLARAGQRFCTVLYVLAAAALVWALVASGSQLAWHTIHQQSPAMSLPMAAPYAALPIGGLLIALHFIARAVASPTE